MRIKKLSKPTVTPEEWVQLKPGRSLDEAIEDTRRRKREWDAKEQTRAQPELPGEWGTTKPLLCPNCFGIGTSKGKRCGTCKGKGVVPRIPVKNGTQAEDL